MGRRGGSDPPCAPTTTAAWPGPAGDGEALPAQDEIPGVFKWSPSPPPGGKTSTLLYNKAHGPLRCGAAPAHLPQRRRPAESWCRGCSRGAAGQERTLCMCRALLAVQAPHFRAASAFISGNPLSWPTHCPHRCNRHSLKVDPMFDNHRTST